VGLSGDKVNLRLTAREPATVAAMFDSLAVYGPGLTVYGPWLIGVIAGLVAFFVTAAIMGVVLRRRDHIRRGGPRRPLPGTIQPIQPVPLQPMRSREPSRQTPHIRWLLVFLAVALVGASWSFFPLQRLKAMSRSTGARAT
jgi:hypothetical protein